MKTIIYKFDPVLYPFPLLVTRNYDSKELDELFYVVNDKDELEDAPEEFIPNPNTIARTIYVVSRKSHMRYILVMLVRPKVIGVGTMAHEADHYANMISDICGFLPDKSTHDEPHAYLVQWAANCVDVTKRGHPEWMNGVLYDNDTDTAPAK